MFSILSRGGVSVAARRSATRRAAVAAIVRYVQGEEQLLFIQRAANPKDPWSGHVALPGGRQQPTDQEDDEVTAMREALEEVGIDLSDRSAWRCAVLAGASSAHAKLGAHC